MIKMASKTLLNSTSSNLPQMGEVLSSWMQRMKIFKVTKEQIGYETVETLQEFDFSGVWQPMSQRQINQKPEGQRDWPWQICHSQTNLPLILDDIIMKEDVKYRIMGKWEWKEYGYYEYHLVEDWRIVS